MCRGGAGSTTPHAMMSRPILSILLLGLFAPIAPVVAGDVKGVVVFAENQITSDEFAGGGEYTDFIRDRDGSLVTMAGGGQIGLRAGMVRAVIEFEDLAKATVAGAEDVARLGRKIEECKAAAGRFPKVRAPLQKEIELLQEVVRKCGEGQVLVGGQWRAKADYEKELADEEKARNTGMTLDGRTLKGVKLISVSGSTARVMHSEGVASLDVSKLDRKQIELLNSTNPSVRIVWPPPSAGAGGREPAASTATGGPAAPAGGAGERTPAEKAASLFEEGLRAALDPSQGEEENARGMRLIEKAADEGDTEAMKFLVLAYGSRPGAAGNPGKALAMLRKAADRGDPDAQAGLGRLLAIGERVPRDPEAAVALLRLSAAQENHAGQTYLGFCYFEGLGVARDPAAAAELFSKAALQGDDLAQGNLGYCYALGVGVERDPKQAAYWLGKAAGRGNKAAEAFLRTMDSAATSPGGAR